MSAKNDKTHWYVTEKDIQEGGCGRVERLNRRTDIPTLHVTCQTTHQCYAIANLAQPIAFLCESSNDSLTVAVPRRGNGGPSARHGI